MSRRDLPSSTHRRMDRSKLGQARTHRSPPPRAKSTTRQPANPYPGRRYPILLVLLAQSAVDQLDEVVALFDRGGVGQGIAGQIQDRRGTRRAGQDG
jgi:hypothetical protein